jgi:PKD repeat protein
MIPTSSLYPDQLDSNTNLFEVHDSLRLRLIEDYNPGNTSIKVDVTDFLIASRISATGLITLTEQCSDIDKRAISFFYNAWDAATGIFSGLEILPTFEDVLKPKNITNVTVNVMAMHHNHLKNALIAIQEFCGTKGLEDNEPFGPTLEGRINFLRRLVLQPKAWFTSDKRNGNVPLEIEFKNMSFRLGTDGTADEVKVTWDFGDQTTSVISYISLISADSMVPENAVDVLVRDTDGGVIKKIYHKAGIFDVQLTVENNFGKDVCVFKDFINARVKAPNEAVINFVEDTATQNATPGVPPNGPYQTVPIIRSPINTLIQIEIPSGENVIGTPNYSYGGEALDESGKPLDRIISYTWQIGDDLSHPNSSQTNASFSVGGVYSLKLRVDTEFGAYRITSYENAIDIVENTNLWLWNIDDSNIATGYEYGLISETFKLFNSPTYAVVRNESFLNSQPENLRNVMKAQFRRNTGFVPRSTIKSGNGGVAMLYWAGGRNQSDPISSEQIKMAEFDGFSGIYLSRSPITRAWNWANLNSPSNSYFVFGTVNNYPAETSPTNTTKITMSLADLSTSQTSLQSSNYLNGAQELAENVSSFDNLGDSIYGHYSVYRTAWKDSTGYILRNDGVGPFFRLKSFYRTEGVLGDQFLNIRKLLDVQGTTKLEGQLTDLSSGIYLINNSGSVSKFDTTATTWTSGGPGVNSIIYRNLQDTSVVGFDNQSNTLLLVSDSDKRAYLSFDYSPNAFLKFSELDLTFSSLGSRPTGTQWIMGVY